MVQLTCEWHDWIFEVHWFNIYKKNAKYKQEIEKQNIPFMAISFNQSWFRFEEKL